MCSSNHDTCCDGGAFGDHADGAGMGLKEEAGPGQAGPGMLPPGSDA